MLISAEGLIFCSNGDVEQQDLPALEAEIEKTKRPSYFERFCRPKGGRAKCTQPACPVTN